MERAALGAALLCWTELPARASDPNDLRTVLFGSLDAGHAGFATFGAKRTLTGPLDRSGPVGMGSLGYGGAVETRPTVSDGGAIRQTFQGSALLGYQWVRDGLVVAALAGPEIDVDSSESSPAFRGGGPALGLRLHGEIWAHPSARTLLTATAIAGTARTPHLWGRVSAGYALWEGVFLGPEASVYVTETYRELRLGAHVTGLTLGRFNLRLSGGLRQEDEASPGGYVGLTAFIKM